MMTELELHILPREDRWHVRRNGASVAVYNTQETALRQACSRAKAVCGRQGLSRWTMVLHDDDDDGCIQRRITVPC